jgi:hypothetical protein
VALSTTEAELIPVSEAGKEVVWLKRLFRKLTNYSDVPMLKCDNSGAEKLTRNPEFHKRTKHIDTKYF